MKRRKDRNGRVLKAGESQRSDGTYMYRTPSVKGKRTCIYAPTLKKLREKEDTLQRDIYDGKDISSRSLTVNDMYQKWVELKRGLKGNTFQNYQYMYEHYVQGDIGNMKILDIRKSDIKAFYNRLHDKSGLRPNTIDVIHTVLLQVLGTAEDDKIIPANPANGALKELKRTYSEEVGTRTALTVNQEQRLLYFVKSSKLYSHWYPLLIILFFTGMRAGELTALQMNDIDLNKGIIYVRHTLVYYATKAEQKKHRDAIFEMHSTKTASGTRQIPMIPAVKAAFKEYISQRNELGIVCKANVDGYDDFIFLNRYGLNMTAHLINRALARIIKEYNSSVTSAKQLPHITCHYARHTMATRMNEAHMEHKARSTILGHTEEDITDRVYTNAFISYLRKEMRKLTTLSKKILK